jgi:pyrimidine-nucleoside phosphorylase
MTLEAIRSGMAKEKFRSLVVAQGGDADYVDEPERFPSARFIQAFHSTRKGHISQVNARVIGEASVVLGAGRTRKGDPIDHSVGLTIHRKVGDVVEKGQPLFTVHANDKNLAKAVGQTVLSAFEWSENPVAPLPLFYE